MHVEKNDEGEEQHVQFSEAGLDLKEKEEKKDEKDEDEAEEDVKLNEAEEEEDKEDGEGDAKEDDEEEDKEDEEEDAEEDEEDFPESKSGSESDEFMEIDQEDFRKDVQCPICLGIIKKTRTMMECLHRFCGECIEKSLRLGNNECPVCRTHCPSQRSLRDDPNFDKFIAILFPNIDSFEEEELNKEEKASNKEVGYPRHSVLFMNIILFVTGAIFVVYLFFKLLTALCRLKNL